MRSYEDSARSNTVFVYNTRQDNHQSAWFVCWQNLAVIRFVESGVDILEKVTNYQVKTVRFCRQDA